MDHDDDDYDDESPPPSGSSPSQVSAYSETMHTHAGKEPLKLDDDDFSVAPSLAVAMRSVVKTSFDQIYERGQKVRLAQRFAGLLSTLACAVNSPAADFLLTCSTLSSCFYF